MRDNIHPGQMKKKKVKKTCTEIPAEGIWFLKNNSLMREDLMDSTRCFKDMQFFPLCEEMTGLI